MKLIAITSPEFFPGEALRIARLLEGDFSLVHLRKPHADIGDCRTLLDRLPEWCWPRIVLHDHFDLIHHYPLGGLHLNGRNPVPPARYYGQLSCSCHSLDEVAARKQEMDYVLLSPIFDSISKRGMPRLSPRPDRTRRQDRPSTTTGWWLSVGLPSTNCPCWNHGISGVLPCWAASGSNRSPFNVALELSVMRTLTVSPIWASPLSNTTILFCPVRPQSCSRLRLL